MSRENIENQLYTINGSSKFCTLKKNKDFNENNLQHLDICDDFSDISSESFDEFSGKNIKELSSLKILYDNNNIQQLIFEHIYKYGLNDLELMGRNFILEQYMFNICNKGSYVKTFYNNEKEDKKEDKKDAKNMIGTIVFSLTSDYEGGQLIIKHN